MKPTVELSALLPEPAACTRVDPDLFFPASYAKGNRRTIEAAKALCRGCMVRSDCLEIALSAGEEHGIWGGLTPDERTRIAISRRLGAHALLTSA